jgi:predicted nucleic acid-binding Zn finger protein
MKMDRKYIVRRRFVALALGAVLMSLFTYATRDTCYVGNGGNALGYGSCSQMIDEVITNG